MSHLSTSISATPQFFKDITEPLQAAWLKIAEIVGGLLPKLVGFLLILILGWLLSKLFAFLIQKLLKLARINVLSEKAGVEKFLQKGGLKRDAVNIVSRIAYWFFIIITFIVAFNSVGLTAVSEVLNQLLLYFPNIFVAMVILIIGFYLARFVSGLVQVLAGNIGVEKPEVVGNIAYAIVIVFVVPIVLNQLRIASDLVTNTFLLLFGALCLALAIAFGLGSKDLVTSLWEKSKLAEKIKPRKE
jgi:hypothetical protein